MKKFTLLTIFLMFSSISLLAQERLTVWGEIELDLLNTVQSAASGISIIQHIAIELRSPDGTYHKVLNNSTVSRDNSIDYSNGKFYFYNVPEGTYVLNISSHNLPRANALQGTYKFSRVSGMNRLLAGQRGRAAEGYVGKFFMTSSGHISPSE